MSSPFRKNQIFHGQRLTAPWQATVLDPNLRGCNQPEGAIPQNFQMAQKLSNDLPESSHPSKTAPRGLLNFDLHAIRVSQKWRHCEALQRHFTGNETNAFPSKPVAIAACAECLLWAGAVSAWSDWAVRKWSVAY